MIEELLPAGAVAVEARQDITEASLRPEEQVAVRDAVDKRRREFTTSRILARQALVRLDLSPAPIPRGPNGEPMWPDGVTGSITHCRGYRACAMARATHVRAIGIDAEPDEPLPRGVLDQIARPEELQRLEVLACNRPDANWDRLLFCAKEAVYKAWFPLTRVWLGFEDATVFIDPRSATFRAGLLRDGLVIDGRPQHELRGRWLMRDGLVLTAIAHGPC